MQLPSPAEVVSTIAEKFASRVIPKGAYFLRSLMLQTLSTCVAANFAIITDQQFMTLLSVLKRETERYYGTHASGSLEFPTARHATRYRDNLKAARGACVTAWNERTVDQAAINRGLDWDPNFEDTPAVWTVAVAPDATELSASRALLDAQRDLLATQAKLIAVLKAELLTT